MCHSIQGRALEYQLFELTINLPTLQPIAEDRLETEDLCLHQAPTIIAVLTLPRQAPTMSDHPVSAIARDWRACSRYSPIDTQSTYWEVFDSGSYSG
jgi:hypothetical protein